jgi:hypothetical protein
LKALIQELEEIHIDRNLEKWNNNEYSIEERRILLTQWVGEAWEQIHRDHKETIIKTFRNLGLSLNPDGSKDSELKIKNLLNIEVGDYTSTSSSAILIDDDNELEGDTIVIQSTYISRSERESIQAENELDVTIDTGNDTEDAFDSDSELDSSEEEDEDMADVREA